MMAQDWTQAFGAGLNVGTNIATVVTANGIGNEIHGNVAAQAEQHGGTMSSGYNGFGNINVGVDAATTVVANGVDNYVGGNVSADASQTAGNCHYHTTIPGMGDLNIGVNVPTLVADNGVGNGIGGNVGAYADQHIADHGFMLPLL